MNNPFLSNDNIFDKLPRRSPAGRRDRTPPKTRQCAEQPQIGQDRVSFGNPGMARRPGGQMQKISTGISSPRYDHLPEPYKPTNKYDGVRNQGIRRNDQQLKAIGDRIKETKCEEIISVNRYFSGAVSSSADFAGFGVRGMAGQNNDGRNQIKMELDYGEKKEMRPMVSQTTSAMMNVPYATSQTNFKEVENKPFIEMNNPFLKQNILPEKAQRPRMSKQASDKVGVVEYREKSITAPHTKPYNPPSHTALSLQSEFNQRPYVATNNYNLPSPKMQIKMNSPSEQIDFSPSSSPKHMLNRDNPHSASEDTLHKLNELFNQNMNSPKTDQFRMPDMDKGPLNYGVSPLASSRDDQIDAKLFEEYIQKCMLNSQGREELRNLVGIDIPEPLNSPTQMQKPFGRNFLNMPTTQTMQSPTSSTTTQNHRQTRTQQSFKEPPPQNPPAYFDRQHATSLPQQQMQRQTESTRPPQYFPREVIIQQKTISSVIIREPSFPNQQHNASQQIEIDQSLPQIKLYNPPVLTEKSNLRGDIHKLPVFPPTTAAPQNKQEELEIKLHVDCDLNSRIQNKMKKLYQSNNQRIFLTTNQKLTMRRYMLRED